MAARALGPEWPLSAALRLSAGLPLLVAFLCSSLSRARRAVTQTMQSCVRVQACWERMVTKGQSSACTLTKPTDAAAERKPAAAASGQQCHKGKVLACLTKHT